METLTSVITPLYQSEKYIEECILSVIAQARDDIEHIIIDNNSSDSGYALAKRYADKYPHIKLLRCSEPGSGPTRNVGIKSAKGRYIAFLDADDIWHPQKLNLQLKAMQDTGAALSWTRYNVVTEKGELIRQQSARTDLTSKQYMMKLGNIGCLTAIYDTKLVGKRYMNKMSMKQDFCLWVDILRTSEQLSLPVVGLTTALADYRVHNSNTSVNKVSAAGMQWKALRGHCKLDLATACFYFGTYTCMGILDRIK